jgi:hypothetical protein
VFSRKFALPLYGGIDAATINATLEPYRSATGLPLATQYTQHGIDCEIRWSDDWRVTPADALQRALVERLGAKSAVVEYGWGVFWRGTLILPYLWWFPERLLRLEKFRDKPAPHAFLIIKVPFKPELAIEAAEMSYVIAPIRRGQDHVLVIHRWRIGWVRQLVYISNNPFVPAMAHDMVEYLLLSDIKNLIKLHGFATEAW